MSHDNNRSKTDRRSFLKLAGLGTVTGGVALVVTDKAADAAEALDGRKAGYRETDHVRAFYDSARF